MAAKPSLSFDNIILTESNQQGQGQLWELKAKKAEYSRDGKTAIVRNIEGVFFDKTGKALLVKANEGQIQTEARIIILSGAVQAHSAQRKTNFTADLVRWLPDQNQIVAEGQVVLRDPTWGVTMTGKQLTGDTGGNTLTMTGEVQATAPRYNMLLKARQAKWQVSSGQLVVDMVTATTPKDQVQAPQLTWHLKEQVLEAPQGISYLRSGVNLKADSGRWQQTQNLLTATGNVDYHQGRLRVQGERASANLKSGIVQVQGRVKTSFDPKSIR
jgi:LPS export ABC transporter protein LptC